MYEAPAAEGKRSSSTFACSLVIGGGGRGRVGSRQISFSLERTIRASLPVLEVVHLNFFLSLILELCPCRPVCNKYAKAF